VELTFPGGIQAIKYVYTIRDLELGFMKFFKYILYYIVKIYLRFMSDNYQHDLIRTRLTKLEKVGNSD